MDDSVIRIRMYRVETALSESFNVTVPPYVLHSADGNTSIRPWVRHQVQRIRTAPVFDLVSGRKGLATRCVWRSPAFGWHVRQPIADAERQLAGELAGQVGLLFQ